MDRINVDLKNLKGSLVKKIAKTLKHGKVIVYPTDTIYGIGCLADRVKAVKKISQIKKRKNKKGYIALVSDLKMAKKYAFIDSEQERLVDKYWPGPVTLIFKGKKGLAYELYNKDEIALRLPKNEFLVKIIKEAGKPILSTSLNVSGEAPVTDLTKIEEQFDAGTLDLIIDAGKLRRRKPSKIINIKNINKLKILRN